MSCSTPEEIRCLLCCFQLNATNPKTCKGCFHWSLSKTFSNFSNPLKIRTVGLLQQTIILSKKNLTCTELLPPWLCRDWCQNWVSCCESIAWLGWSFSQKRCWIHQPQIQVPALSFCSLQRSHAIYFVTNLLWQQRHSKAATFKQKKHVVT